MADLIYMAKSKWTALLDSIRAKGGSSALMTADQAKAAIDAIPSGGGGYTIEEVAEKTISSDITITSTTLPGYALYGFNGITRVTCPNLTMFSGEYALAYLTGLRGVYADDFPSLIGLARYMFYGSSGDFAVFANGVRTGLLCFSTTGFRVIDLTITSDTPNIYGIFDRTFNNSASLNTLILRHNYVSKLSGVNAFNGTPFASSGTGGTLYVPQALISEYQAATNWSTILGYANNSIQAIEGSIYETQYADGTPIE